MMNSDLSSDYGYVTFSKGSKFYHSSESQIDSAYEHPHIYFSLFFIFQSRQNKLYEIVLKNNITLLFMIKYISGRLISAGPDLCSKYLNIDYDDDDDFSAKREPQLVDLIVNQGFDGWYTSLENNCVGEVLLFTGAKHKHIDDLFTYREISESHEPTVKLYGSSTLCIGKKVKLDKKRIGEYLQNSDDDNYCADLYVFGKSALKKLIDNWIIRVIDYMSH